MLKKVDVITMGLDKVSNSPVVFLRIENTHIGLPIWIGACEATYLALAINEQKTPRPLTHDLLLNILENEGYSLKKIEINNMENDIYYSNIFLEKDDNEIVIDSRPSDALILAIKSKIPIYVKDKLAIDNGIDISFIPIEDHDSENEENKRKEFKEFLENFDIDTIKKHFFDEGNENNENDENK
ncbi:bifunctional nuclease family protein [Marinitoga aeolica]|uniref:Bifunctional nuclease family protein n=1 Tax=Marinitoga aeolica TaxID=2809031 RepID=A0ABY8PP97_9BACT|nr:bifunctional nuclease family protein [Marinitoga aeolica]WGS64440.1 bifunctional nuclease family protein [Marinitoga aeolica]